MRIKSDSNQTSSLSIALIILGGLIIYLVNHTVDPRPGVHWAYLSGLFLITLGTYVLVMSEKVMITTHSAKKGLQVTRRNFSYRKTEFISYSDIQSVHTVRVGRRAGLKTYHLVIRLNKGKKLFTGRWSQNPEEINAIGDELAKEIGCAVTDTPVYSKPDIMTALWAGLGAVLLYALWYRTQVGKFCLAMWHGTVPAILIPFVFTILLSLFRFRKK